MTSPSSLTHCWVFHDKCNPRGAWISVGTRKQIRRRIAHLSVACVRLPLSAKDTTQISSFLPWGLEMKIPRVLNEINRVAEPAKNRGSYRKQNSKFIPHHFHLFLCMWVGSMFICAYICREACVRVWTHVCMWSPHFCLLKQGVSLKPEFTNSSWPSCPVYHFQNVVLRLLVAATPAWFIPVEDKEDGRSTDA